MLLQLRCERTPEHRARRLFRVQRERGGPIGHGRQRAGTHQDRGEQRKEKAEKAKGSGFQIMARTMTGGECLWPATLTPERHARLLHFQEVAVLRTDRRLRIVN